MRRCPHCEAQNLPDSPGCVQCGKPFLALDQTIVGHAPPEAKPARFRGTMIGIAPPGAAPPNPAPPAADASRAGGLNRTMIGIAPLEATGPARNRDDAPALPVDERGYPSPPPPPEAALRLPPTGGGTVPHIAPHQKTMLGVARPGIAPLNPNQAKAAVTRPLAASTAALPSSSGASQRSLPGHRSLGPPLVTSPPDARPKPGIPALAAVAIVGAGGLFAAAAVVWLFYRGHGAIEAHAASLANGTEQLELQCGACDDGTVARLDAAKATFAQQRATLPLTRPLRVGENPMTLTLVSPRGKQSFVDVSVPIAFRVRGDTSGLEAPTPELRVLVSAVAGSSVLVDGRPVALNAEGEGRYAIDVSAELTGLDPAVKPLEHRLSYTVTPPSGLVQSGTVTLQAGITPLVIDAPGPAVMIDTSNFVLAGRTAKGGSLTVSDRPITVDATGRFAQMMNVSAPGETTITIRASSTDAAPRLFPLRVKRVDSLAHEAERVRQRATSNYSAIAEQAQTKRGWAVALDGSVVETRTENYSTVIVMDVQSGCTHAPCLARVTYGAPFSISRGDKFSAFGEVAGVVDGPRSGTHIPEIHADFLLRPGK